MLYHVRLIITGSDQMFYATPHQSTVRLVDLRVLRNHVHLKIVQCYSMGLSLSLSLNNLPGDLAIKLEIETDGSQHLSISFLKDSTDPNLARVHLQNKGLFKLWSIRQNIRQNCLENLANPKTAGALFSQTVIKTETLQTPWYKEEKSYLDPPHGPGKVR